jgi:hypothetical protein
MFEPLTTIVPSDNRYQPFPPGTIADKIGYVLACDWYAEGQWKVTSVIVRNHTPHPVTILAWDTQATFYPETPSIRRKLNNEKPIGNFVPTRSYGEVLNLPDRQPGTILIVSGLTLLGVDPKRDDVFAPGPTKKNPGQRIFGCLGLIRRSDV